MVSENLNSLIVIIEIIGTCAFASSGAMVAIQKKMDIFGVNVLGITTALGGGLIRDLILGKNPPSMFLDYQYALCAILVSTLLFTILYFNKNILSGKFFIAYENMIMAMDAIGLGIFTVVGINTAIECGNAENIFLLIFVGVLTGVGGGVLRDVLAGNLPYILVKHVYACASLIGAMVYVAIYKYNTPFIAITSSSLIIILIRYFAARNRWNLPRIE